MTVKRVDAGEIGAKEVDKWIKDIRDLHRSKPNPSVQYSRDHFHFISFADKALKCILSHFCFALQGNFKETGSILLFFLLYSSIDPSFI